MRWVIVVAVVGLAGHLAAEPILSSKSVWEERRALIAQLPGWWAAPDSSALLGIWEWEEGPGKITWMDLEEPDLCLRLDRHQPDLRLDRYDLTTLECTWRVQSREDLEAGRILFLYYRRNEIRPTGRTTHVVMFRPGGPGKEDDELHLVRGLKDLPIEVRVWKRRRDE